MLYLGLTSILFLLRYALSRHGAALEIFYFFTLVWLFFFSAFRFRVGCDWGGYYHQYLAAVNLDWSSILEISESGWWGILVWVHYMELPYPVINIISSAIFFLGIHAFARRQPDPLGFLVLLFPILIINMPMSGVRQGAAIGLICIGFLAFIDRRPLWFTVWVVLASLLHSSAVVFILLLPLTTGKYSKYRLLLAAILAVPGILALASGDSADVATSRYINSDVDSAGAIFRVGTLFLTALYFFKYIRKSWHQCWPRDYTLASIGAIGMVLVFFLIPLSTVIGDRFGYYLIPLQAMIFARLPFLPFRTNKTLHSAAPYLGLLLVFAVWSQRSWIFSLCYTPYQTWIFGFPASAPLGY